MTSPEAIQPAPKPGLFAICPQCQYGNEVIGIPAAWQDLDITCRACRLPFTVTYVPLVTEPAVAPAPVPVAATDPDLSAMLVEAERLATRIGKHVEIGDYNGEDGVNLMDLQVGILTVYKGMESSRADWKQRAEVAEAQLAPVSVADAAAILSRDEWDSLLFMYKGDLTLAGQEADRLRLEAHDLALRTSAADAWAAVDRVIGQREELRAQLLTAQQERAALLLESARMQIGLRRLFGRMTGQWMTYQSTPRYELDPSGMIDKLYNYKTAIEFLATKEEPTYPAIDDPEVVALLAAGLARLEATDG